MRRLAVLVIGIGLALALAGPASASDISKRDPAGDVKAARLTAKERQALDIVSVDLSGEPGLGVVVKATFKGNVTKLLGTGGLRKALVALVLEPKSTAQAPAAIVTQGSGPVGVTLARTSSSTVGVVRHGRTLTFFLLGPGLENVGKVSVKAFVRSPGNAPGRIPLGVVQPSEATIEGLVQSEAADVLDFAEEDGFADSLSCLSLLELRDEVLDLIDFALGQEAALRRLDSTPSVKAALRRVSRLIVYLYEIDGDVQAALDRRCPLPGGLLVAIFVWSLFGGSPDEVVGTGQFSASASPGRRETQSQSPIDAVRVVVPDRKITNFLCPSKLPAGSLSTTVTTSDTLTCTGGTLALGEQFQLNVRMTPAPTAGMGGQLHGRQDGVFQGPFEITGP